MFDRSKYEGSGEIHVFVDTVADQDDIAEAIEFALRDIDDGPHPDFLAAESEISDRCGMVSRGECTTREAEDAVSEKAAVFFGAGVGFEQFMDSAREQIAAADGDR